MDAREELPRISIDSLQDWERVKNDYRSAAMEKLEYQIRMQGLSDQRDALTQHLNRYIERIFSIAQPNLRINGRNYEDLEADEDVEAFDEALDRHIWSLADNRLNWHTKLAEARRMKPSAVAATMQELFTMQGEKDAAEPPPIAHDAEEEEEDTTAHDEIIYASAQQASATGQELSQTIPSQHERSERSKVVTAEIKMLKP